MAYAARHPRRVTRLILHGTVAGRPATFETETDWDEEQTWRSMIRVGWAKEHPVFRRTFTQGFIPGANEEQMRWFDELQRMASSPENIITSRIAKQAVDIRAEMQRITAPTLILRAIGDAVVDFGNALEVIEMITHARLVALDSANHILLADEPALPAFLDEVGRSWNRTGMPWGPPPGSGSSPLRLCRPESSTSCAPPPGDSTTRPSRPASASASGRSNATSRTATESWA
ncbi:MAG: alpha/beta hydrolase [Anaerolineales bacterium]|nr:alpha/beta hydrolase [Anaerolineales bacterium]